VRHQDFRNSRRRDFDANDYQPQPRAFGTRSRFSEPRLEAPSGPPVLAVVKWFSPEKGFGFVELSGGSGDAFLHGSLLAQNGIGGVQPSECVSASGRDPTINRLKMLTPLVYLPSGAGSRSAPIGPPLCDHSNR